MIRRLTIALCALLGAASLTACATFDRNDLAATANDAELSQDDLSAILASDLSATLLEYPAGGDTVSGDVARGLLSAWVRLTVWSDDIEVPAEITALAEEQAAKQFGDQWTEAPQVLRDLLIADGGIGALLQDGTVTQEQLLAILAGADVTVDSRYGAWDSAQSVVVPLG